MEIILEAIAVIAFALVIDWLVTTRIASLDTQKVYVFSFRVIRSAAIVATLSYLFIYLKFLNDIESPQLTGLIPFFLGLTVFFIAAVKNVNEEKM